MKGSQQSGQELRELFSASRQYAVASTTTLFLLLLGTPQAGIAAFKVVEPQSIVAAKKSGSLKVIRTDITARRLAPHGGSVDAGAQRTARLAYSAESSNSVPHAEKIALRMTPSLKADSIAHPDAGEGHAAADTRLILAAQNTALLTPVSNKNHGMESVAGEKPSVAATQEPQMYAMMLAGLGLMGFVASRRRN
jgi:PEP-CTERM motif-containing protein